LGILDYFPSLLSAELLRLLEVIERADRLAWTRESRIVLIHQNLGKNRSDVVFQTLFSKGVGDDLLDHIPHQALSGCTTNIEGQWWHDVSVCLDAQEQVSNLGTVAMSNDDAVFAIQKAQNLLTRLAKVGELLINRTILIRSDKSITT
jgi:hypothetical protein